MTFDAAVMRIQGSNYRDIHFRSNPHRPSGRVANQAMLGRAQRLRGMVGIERPSVRALSRVCNRT